MINILIMTLGLISCAILYSRFSFLHKFKNNNDTYYDVSIIIPAYNEEKNLKGLLPSILSQQVKFKEVIVVDDHSFDKTSQIAKNYGVKVIRIDKHPPGWVGKNYACFVGAKAASGKTLLFLDADVRIKDGGLSALINAFSNNKGAISVQPYHYTKNFYEQFSFFFNLVELCGTNSFSLISNDNSSTGLYGPVIMIDRDDYFYVNGHESVARCVVEDLYLGNVLKTNNINIHNYLGKDAIHFRMYPHGFKTLIEGWSKNFAIGASKTNPLLLLCSICFITFLLNIPISIYSAINSKNGFFSSIILYIIVVFILRYLGRKIGYFFNSTYLLYPIYLCGFIIIFIFSIIKINILKKVTWKGKVIKI